MIYGDWAGRWGRSFPENEALVDVINGRRFSYGRFAGDVHRLAVYLSDELGLAKGDRVCCLSFNRTEYLTLFFALGRIGAILVPLNFRLAAGEYVYFLEDTRARVLFFDRNQPGCCFSIETTWKSFSSCATPAQLNTVSALTTMAPWAIRCPLP